MPSGKANFERLLGKEFFYVSIYQRFRFYHCYFRGIRKCIYKSAWILYAYLYMHIQISMNFNHSPTTRKVFKNYFDFFVLNFFRCCYKSNAFGAQLGYQSRNLWFYQAKRCNVSVTFLFGHIHIVFYFTTPLFISNNQVGWTVIYEFKFEWSGHNLTHLDFISLSFWTLFIWKYM